MKVISTKFHFDFFEIVEIRFEYCYDKIDKVITEKVVKRTYLECLKRSMQHEKNYT